MRGVVESDRRSLVIGDMRAVVVDETDCAVKLEAVRIRAFNPLSWPGQMLGIHIHPSEFNWRIKEFYDAGGRTFPHLH